MTSICGVKSLIGKEAVFIESADKVDVLIQRGGFVLKITVTAEEVSCATLFNEGKKTVKTKKLFDERLKYGIGLVKECER